MAKNMLKVKCRNSTLRRKWRIVFKSEISSSFLRLKLVHRAGVSIKPRAILVLGIL